MAWQGSKRFEQEALSVSFRLGMGLAELVLLTLPMSCFLDSKGAVSEGRARAGHTQPRPASVVCPEGSGQGLLAGQVSVPQGLDSPYPQTLPAAFFHG